MFKRVIFFYFSILYADIVNFTPLSEQLSASDLVRTLNDLFGRFDQIAQVINQFSRLYVNSSLKRHLFENEGFQCFTKPSSISLFVMSAINYSVTPLDITPNHSTFHTRFL